MQPSPRTKPRSWWPRQLKIVRRVHMYAGLLLLPWLLFFGISGLSFNHPNVGEDVRGQRLGPAELEQMTGLTPWPAAKVAQAVVAQLNQAAPGAPGPRTTAPPRRPGSHGSLPREPGSSTA